MPPFSAYESASRAQNADARNQRKQRGFSRGVDNPGYRLPLALFVEDAELARVEHNLRRRGTEPGPFFALGA
jgi:hypothetical protein